MAKTIRESSAGKCVGCGGTGGRWTSFTGVDMGGGELITMKCGHSACTDCLWKVRACPRCRMTGIPLVAVEG